MARENKRILVCGNVNQRLLNRLRTSDFLVDQPKPCYVDPASLVYRLSYYDCMIVRGGIELNAVILKAARKRLKLIVCVGKNCDGIDIKEAARQQITVRSMPGNDRKIRYIIAFFDTKKTQKPSP